MSMQHEHTNNNLIHKFRKHLFKLLPDRQYLKSAFVVLLLSTNVTYDLEVMLIKLLSSSFIRVKSVEKWHAIFHKHF
jgi:hypothetical protein